MHVCMQMVPGLLRANTPDASCSWLDGTCPEQLVSLAGQLLSQLLRFHAGGRSGYKLQHMQGLILNACHHQAAAMRALLLLLSSSPGAFPQPTNEAAARHMAASAPTGELRLLLALAGKETETLGMVHMASFAAAAELLPPDSWDSFNDEAQDHLLWLLPLVVPARLLHHIRTLFPATSSHPAPIDLTGSSFSAELLKAVKPAGTHGSSQAICSSKTALLLTRIFSGLLRGETWGRSNACEYQILSGVTSVEVSHQQAAGRGRRPRAGTRSAPASAAHPFIAIAALPVWQALVQWSAETSMQLADVYGAAVMPSGDGRT